MAEFYPNDFIDVPEVALHAQQLRIMLQMLLSCKGFQIFVQDLWKQISAKTFAMVYKLLKFALLCR